MYQIYLRYEDLYWLIVFIFSMFGLFGLGMLRGYLLTKNNNSLLKELAIIGLLLLIISVCGYFTLRNKSIEIKTKTEIRKMI